MTAAVEETLAPQLRGLAQANDVAIEKSNGRPQDLRVIAEQLAKNEVLRADVRDEIGFYLSLRNETNHGRGERVSVARIDRVIAGIRELRDTGLLGG